MPIARQGIGKQIPARANARKNKTPIATQRISKHTSLTIEAVFSVRSVQRGYKEVFGSIGQNRSSGVESRVEVETPACWDMSLELNWVESSELAAAE
jgi:hypothetical protein